MKEKVLIVFFMLAILTVIVLPQESFAQWVNNLAHLDMPHITINPILGKPGTEITINVTNLVPPPVGADPRIEFFVYMPFASAIGTNVPGQCDGQDCLPLYTFEDIQSGKIEDKILTLRLFSTQNPAPTVQSGMLESVCDLRINNKIVQSYGKACNEYDQPLGVYEIKFGWGIKQAETYDKGQALTFTVIKQTSTQEEKFDKPEDLLIKQYERGLISTDQFDKGLKDLGYNSGDIRKIKGMIGKLDHQMGQSRIIIPDWIKTNAKWWSEDRIGDMEFVNGIQYLIREGIMKVPEPGTSVWNSSPEIPDWIKKNAKWWSQDLLSDIDFVKGIQYLIEKGIIRIN